MRKAFHRILKGSPRGGAAGHTVGPGAARLSSDLLDAVLPAVCIHCEARLGDASDLACGACGRRLDMCRRRRLRSIGIAGDEALRVQVFSLWTYATGSPVRSLHRALKYGGRSDIGRMAGRRMGSWARSRLKCVDQASVVLPVPSHPVRIAERGYNHAAMLALGVCDELRVGCAERGLRRIRLSVSQSGVSRGARAANVRGAFAVGDPGLLSGRPVFIVDDVFTTGATLRETCTLVHEAGATYIAALTMAVRVVR